MNAAKAVFDQLERNAAIHCEGVSTCLEAYLECPDEEMEEVLASSLAYALRQFQDLGGALRVVAAAERLAVEG